jgi:hypothetical protein
MRLFVSLGGGFAARIALAALLVVGLLPSGARAQSQASTGQISGAVTDQQGAAVRASVRVRNVETGLEQAAETDGDGLYKFVLLPPGVYTITASAANFQDSMSEGNQVVVGRTIDVPLVLGVSGVAEQVTVTAGEVEVQTTRSEPDAVIDETAIDNLPINGRRFQDFATLTPTAQVEGQRQQISLAGQRGINANINIDGSDYNQPFFGGIRGGERSNFAPTVPQESVREFQVVASGYSAEFGRSTGGIINVVTKTGTNDLHGSGFYLLRHKELAASNEFYDTQAEGNPEIDTDDRVFQFAPTRQQWGASVGGPIKTDRLFFFGAYEQQRLRTPRSTLFPALNSIIPSSTISLADIDEAAGFFRSLEGPGEATNDAVLFTGRVDWNLSDRLRLNGRYNFSDNEAVNGVSTGDGIVAPTINRPLSNDGTEKDRTHTVTVQAASFLTPTIVNELRTQFSYEQRPRLSNSALPLVPTTVGSFGSVNFLPTTQDDKKFQIADNLTWSRGDHTAKFGVDYNYVTAFQEFGFNQFGAFTFTTSDPLTQLELLSVGGPTADRFDSTAVRLNVQIGNLLADLQSQELALFAQDSWRIRPNFTLNAGLRWEGQFNSTPEATNADLVDQILEFGEFPIGVSVDPRQIPDSTDQWAPRLGFAWDPFNDSKTVVRGYGGIYYARSPLLIFASPINNFRETPGDVSVTLPFPVASGQPRTVYDQLLLAGIDLNAAPLGNLPIITAADIARVAEALGFEPNPFLGANVTLVGSDFRNPKSAQFGIGFEREVAEGLTAGVDFTYVNTVNLERNRDVNLPAPAVLTSASNPQDQLALEAGVPVFFGDGRARAIPTLRQITIRESSAHSRYQALTLRTKFDRSWGQFNAFYTLSKNLSDDDNERSSGGFIFVDAFDAGSEYSYSELDRRHQFVANPVVFLPWAFTVSSAIRLQSGVPVNVGLGTDLNRDQTNNDRPYASPGVMFARNSERNRPQYNVDLRVDKAFRFGETQRLVFSSEFFNLFNFQNIQYAGLQRQFCEPGVALTADCVYRGVATNPNFLEIREQNPESPNFGRLITSNSATPQTFQAQFGLRYEF